MPAACIGVVHESSHPRYQSGDWVQGIWGWQDFVTLPGGPEDRQLPMEEGGILHLPEPPPGSDYLDFFGLFGVHGLTAFFGMTDVGKVKPGDTVLISAAAGAIGSLATQIARNLGCRVVGLCELILISNTDQTTSECQHASLKDINIIYYFLTSFIF